MPSSMSSMFAEFSSGIGSWAAVVASAIGYVPS